LSYPDRLGKTLDTTPAWRFASVSWARSPASRVLTS